MADKIRTIISWVRTKPLLTAIPLLIALSLTGLPAQAPKVNRQVPDSPPKVAKVTKAAPAAISSPPNPFVVKRVLNIDGPFTHGTYVWDDEGVPAGPVVITIDLKAQTLSVFRNGYEIGAAVILYGADDKPTPLGSFPILEKDADHVSNLYDAPMPYMLRLTNDGVAIHGSNVEWGSATHGCIGVPNAFAALLFAQVKLGDRVIITDGKMMAVG